MNSTIGKGIIVAVVFLIVGVAVGILVLGGDDSEPNTDSLQQERSSNEDQESVESDGEKDSEEIVVRTLEEYVSYCSVFNSNVLSLHSSWGGLVQGVMVDLNTMSSIVPPDEVIDYHNLSLDAWNDILDYAATQPQESAIDESAQEIQDAKDMMVSISQQIDTNTLNMLTDAGCVTEITF